MAYQARYLHSPAWNVNYGCTWYAPLNFPAGERKLQWDAYLHGSARELGGSM